MITVRGTVSTGKGIGQHFIAIPWARKQIKEKLGFAPYLGTLNLHLPEVEAERLRTALTRFEGVEITPEPGFFAARCFSALIMSRIKGALVIPQTRDYPHEILEVIAPIDLRHRLSLEDGDEIHVTIFLTNVRRLPASSSKPADTHQNS